MGVCLMWKSQVFPTPPAEPDLLRHHAAQPNSSSGRREGGRFGGGSLVLLAAVFYSSGTYELEVLTPSMRSRLFEII